MTKRVLFIYTYIFASLQSVWAECGGSLTGSSGEISIYNDGRDNPYGTVCTWTIEAEENKLVAFNVTHMHIETFGNCSANYLELKDGNVIDEIYCGYEPKEYVSQSRLLTIEYASFLDGDEPWGFTARYHKLTDPVCGYNVAHKAGTIGTSLVDDNYAYSSTYCIWHIIRTSEVGEIDLYIMDMDTKFQDKCNNSHIQVSYSGTTIDGICGTDQLPVLTTTANVLTVELVSTGDLIDAQFTAVYLIRDADCYGNSRCLCGGVLTNSTGLLSAPDEDQNGMELDCYWLLVAEKEHVISVEIIQMAIPHVFGTCYWDYLEIYDGNLNKLIGTYCYNYVSSIHPEVVTTSNLMFLRFVSDNAYSPTAFTVNYTHIIDESSLVSTSIQQNTTTSSDAMTQALAHSQTPTTSNESTTVKDGFTQMRVSAALTFSLAIIVSVIITVQPILC